MKTIDVRFSENHDRLIWCLDECLEAHVTRSEINDSTDYPLLLISRLLPLSFLAMPVHDNPR